MKVFRITVDPEAAERDPMTAEQYHTNEAARLDRAPLYSRIDVIEMTPEEYHGLGSNMDSARFFGQISTL